MFQEKKVRKKSLLFQNQLDPKSIGIATKSSNLSCNLYTKFREFLIQKSRKNQIDDDIGFEINFASFQKEPKVSRM